MLPELDAPSEFGMVAPADGMPTRALAQFTNEPPLLPGLMAASVWMAKTSSAETPPSAGTWTLRPSALTMPAVTLLDSPSGAPRAKTG